MTDPLALEERRARLRALETETALKALEATRASMAMYASLCPGGVLDERGKRLFREKVGGVVEAPPVDLNAPLTVGAVATALGLTPRPGDLISAGKALRKSYAARHGADPPVESYALGSSARVVRLYTERDRDLIVAALQAAVGRRVG